MSTPQQGLSEPDIELARLNVEPSGTLVEPRISVVIPVCNGGRGFTNCLRGVAKAVPPPAEVIIVADGDGDGAWHLGQRYGARILRIPTRGGPARARNLGARAAGGDILFFIDADVTIPAEAVGQVVAIFSHEPDLAAVFGSYDDAPAASNFLSQYKDLLHHYIHQTSGESAATFWAGCGAIRRDVFFAVGGFDEGYRQPSIEDIELGYRLKQAGYRIRLWKTLQVKHSKRWGVGSLLRSDFFHRAIPWTELILRDRRLINDLNLRLSSRVSVVLAHTLVVALVGSWRWASFWIFAWAAAVGLLALNAPVYRFFWRKRGLGFALLAIPWHWFYYVYSGFAFALGMARHLLHNGRSWALRLVSPPAGHKDLSHQELQ